MDNNKLELFISYADNAKIWSDILRIYDSSRLVGAGLATIALAGVGAGVGFVFGKLLESNARNSNISDELFRLAMIGFAVTEALGLFALMIAFMLLYAV